MPLRLASSGFFARVYGAMSSESMDEAPPSCPSQYNIQALVRFFSDELRCAADEASDFLEFLFFLWAEGMVLLKPQVEFRMRGAKLVIYLDRNEMKVLVEFVPDFAT